MPLPPISPPLLNSSNPWATSLEDLQTLFDTPSTGAITTRTSLLDGFAHNPDHHQYTFFNPLTHSSSSSSSPDPQAASLNTLGYSPLPLSSYLQILPQVLSSSSLPEPAKSSKPIIISVTGTPAEIRECRRRIQLLQTSVKNPLCMELNLSCPNIPEKPPPAYERDLLVEYLRVLVERGNDDDGGDGGGGGGGGEAKRRVAVGIKIPPYTYRGQFGVLVEGLLAVTADQEEGDGARGCGIDFITATNTLGSCLLLSSSGDGVDEGAVPVLGSALGAGVGGMAGAPLHPLALGNVKTIRGLLDGHARLKGVDIIGVGGVGDNGGFRRMRAVGAKVVGVGTALGREGVAIFEKILQM